MKKKIMFGALAALFLSVGIFAATNLQERKQVSDLTLANIEAMTQVDDGDMSGRECGGYRSWNSERPLFGIKSEFYSCTYELQEGFRPEGNCLK